LNLVFLLKNFLQGKIMKALKIIQLMVAGALALGLNEAALARSIHLNSPSNYINFSNHRVEYVDYFSFSLKSLSDVTFSYKDSGLLSNSTLSIFSDKGALGPNPIRRDIRVGSIASITSRSGSFSDTNLAPGRYYLLVDVFLPPAARPRLNDRFRFTPATGNFVLTGYRITPVSPVPEPNVFALMLVGVGLVGFMSYRRQRYFN
jgi:hypothetical protein